MHFVCLIFVEYLDLLVKNILTYIAFLTKDSHIELYHTTLIDIIINDEDGNDGDEDEKVIILSMVSLHNILLSFFICSFF